ncbi:MAG: hypothetical protein HYX40_00680 [Sphingobacteriales bacterium]|nr:hypothetical protein [Sphingobacteriales bacterium]
MSENQQVSRPPLITLLCSLVFIAGIYMIVQTFAGAFHANGTLFSPFIVLFIIIAITGASGMWSMEKWGFIVYMIAASGFQVIPIIFGVWTYWWLLPMVLLFLFAVHVREMK